MCYGNEWSCIRTIAEYFQTNLGSNVTVAQGVDISSSDTSKIQAALDAVAASDQVIMVLGITTQQEHEGIDRSNTLLPGQQENFALQVIAKAAGKPVILVLINGGIVSIDNLINGSNAIIEGFYPGARTGEALFKSIFGIQFGWGRLPVTIYASDYTTQVDMKNFNMTKSPGRTYRYFTGKPLFEFGFGLTYNTFGISASLTNNSTISAIVKNLGSYAGDNVIMVYHRVSTEIWNGCGHPVPFRALVDFQRVKMGVQGTSTVTFTITADKLSLTNNNGVKVVYPGVHYFDVSDGVASSTVQILV